MTSLPWPPPPGALVSYPAGTGHMRGRVRGYGERDGVRTVTLAHEYGEAVVDPAGVQLVEASDLTRTGIGAADPGAAL